MLRFQFARAKARHPGKEWQKFAGFGLGGTQEMPGPLYLLPDKLPACSSIFSLNGVVRDVLYR